MHLMLCFLKKFWDVVRCGKYENIFEIFLWFFFYFFHGVGRWCCFYGRFSLFFYYYQVFFFFFFSFFPFFPFVSFCFPRASFLPLDPFFAVIRTDGYGHKKRNNSKNNILLLSSGRKQSTRWLDDGIKIKLN